MYWIVGGLAAIALAFGVWFGILHPCLKYESYECEVTECRVHVPYFTYNPTTKTNDLHFMCGAYETRKTTCQRCVERQK